VTTFSQRKTPAGFLVGEVVSALQKDIRRGNEREALFWATELERAGFVRYVWERLTIIASEDVGIADSNVIVQVVALRDAWQARFDKETEKGKKLATEATSSRIFLIHAVLVLTRALKSRICDHAYVVMYEGDRAELAAFGSLPWEIPDYALDGHTARGRRMGRGIEFFYAESAQLGNAVDVGDEFKALAVEIDAGRKK
jgi:replication-associated recombination protein RarA